MAVTVDSFLLAYPDFAPMHDADVTLVPAMLARAELRIGSAWPTDIRDSIVELQTAHMLSLMPAGRNAKLSEPGKPTSYQLELKERKTAFAYARSRIV
jgi:hypothetical protein